MNVVMPGTIGRSSSPAVNELRELGRGRRLTVIRIACVVRPIGCPPMYTTHASAHAPWALQHAVNLDPPGAGRGSGRLPNTADRRRVLRGDEPVVLDKATVLPLRLEEAAYAKS
jgi:hypothetical protein